MPIEYNLLLGRPTFYFCPACGAAFDPLMRGCVQSAWRRFFRLAYCCLICSACHKIVGYERP